MKTFVVDTHTLVWFLSRSPRLSRSAHTILRDPTVRLIIPAIVLAEIKYLSNRGRFAQTLDDVLRVIGTDPRCLVYPIDLGVVQQAPAALDIHDGLIVGTALTQSTAVDGILTCDEAIAKSGLVPVIW
ncbi:MAG: PIN domain-containing protein [Deltaproteobacteria bacterium]|nr:PIN domain-containing protein [Deltaproteobacteria bacterium]